MRLLALVLGFCFPSPDAVGASLDRVPGAELVVFDRQAPGRQTRVLAATRVRAPLGTVLGVLNDPAAYRRAVPSFRKAEVVHRRGEADLLIRWELEVPLWNLSGKLWLVPTAGGVDLDLVDGDMSPGLLQIRARASGDGVLLTIDGHANIPNANWATRRLASRSPLAEPAMSASAVWSLLRALALEATHTPRPRAAMAAPALATVDGHALGALAASLAPGLVVASVQSRADGRLDRVQVAVPVKAPFPFDDPKRWHALPGWQTIEVRPARWRVDTRLPFVDLDALWALAPGPDFRAVAVQGDTSGAVMGWDLVGGVAVFSSHPRLEKSGYVARKFIEAEPILEQGLALGLAYVDAVALTHGGQ